MTFTAAAILLASLGFAETSSSTTAPATYAPGTKRVLIVPTLARGLVDRPPIDPRWVLSFSEELAATAAEVFSWRRWEIVPSEDVETALDSLGARERCRDATCFDTLARRNAATHWMASALIQTNGDNCQARGILYDVLTNQRAGIQEKLVRPCSPDNLMLAASEMGRELADGPREPVKVTLNLTPLPVPSLEIPDIADVSLYRTSTVARARRGATLEEALEIYREKHLFLFDDAESGKFFVGRSRDILTECGVRRAASAPLARTILEFCEGNDWEWLWLGVPAGGLIALGSIPELDTRRSANVLGFTFGTAIAIISGALALSLNVDAKAPEEGVYLTPREGIEDLIHSANEELRRVLDLTEAEVVVAGMPL